MYGVEESIEQKAGKGRLYDRLGVHKGDVENEYVFRTAKNGAERAELTGDFNMWGGTPMEMTEDGVWEARIRSDISLEGTCYKYRFYMGDECVLEPDAYARYAQWGEHDASIVYFGEYEWGDSEWMEARKSTRKDVPINIYQLHLGSWRVREGRSYKDGDVYLNYRDIAAELVGYVSDMGYTHISLLPLTESKAGNAFAPTSRHGRPDDLKFFVDVMHRGGIGVILQWSEPCSGYEDDPDIIVSNATYWLDEFHIDGLCVRENAPYAPDIFDAVKREYPDALTVCSEDKGKLISPSVDLFLDRKWSETVIDYALSDPQYKKYKYGKLNRSLTESFGRRNVLPISSEDVSSGKRTLIDKMQGGYEEKFARLRLFYSFMMTHPGKKLTFMGCEIGEGAEWNGRDPLEWFLVDCDANCKLKRFFRTLNRLYLKTPALWENDFSWRGFEWITPIEPHVGVLAFRRISEGGAQIISVMNFNGDKKSELTVSWSPELTLVYLLNSDGREFGGKDGLLFSDKSNEKKGMAHLCLPPLSAAVLKLEKEKKSDFFEKAIDYSRPL